eukprot:scaffold8279_cov116-Isochrysis_galbana.AAC.1
MAGERPRSRARVGAPAEGTATKLIRQLSGNARQSIRPELCATRGERYKEPEGRGAAPKQ